MFDFGLGTAELLLIAMVALIVVGPKELPGLLRTIGRWVGKVRALASDFQAHLDDLSKESGIEDVKKEVRETVDEMSVEDLDREFAEMERELREQLAADIESGKAPKDADDEDLLEEEERPLPDTIDLDRPPGEADKEPDSEAEKAGDEPETQAQEPAEKAAADSK